MLKDAFDIFKTLSGHWRPRLIYFAVKLGIIEALLEGSLSGAELARRAGVKVDPLLRVLRGLVRLGILEEPETHRFALTEVGRSLRPGAPEGLASLAILAGEEHDLAWRSLPEALRTGEIAFEVAHQQSYFKYLEGHQERARLWSEAMGGVAGFLYPRVTAEHDFSQYRRVVDVGGGYGKLLSLILTANETCRGVLFDRPAVVERAGHLLPPSVRARCEMVGGDFFESVPSGGDLYVLSNVLHDWDDSHARRILQTCRRAMSRDARLLLVEMVLSSEYEPELARGVDLVMLVLFGGRERTAEEFHALLSSAGFQLAAIKPVQPMTCLVEAVPVPER
jgi:hypothetical protein